jgi:hypothetical protein
MVHQRHREEIHVTQRNPITRTVPAAPITATRKLSDVYQPMGENVPLSDLVGRFLHVYGMERFTSDQYGEGVRLSVREADANGVELEEEFTIAAFAFRIRQMANTILGEAAYAPFNPPIRCQVTSYSTSKGQGFDLVDA